MAIAQNYSDSMGRLSAAQTDDAERVAMRDVISILGNPTITETIATEHIKLLRNKMKKDHRRQLSLSKSVVEASVLGKLSEAEAQDVENGVPVIVYGNNGSPYRMNFQRYGDREYYRLKKDRLFDFWKDQQISMRDPFQVWLFLARDPATNLLRFVIARVNQETLTIDQNSESLIINPNPPGNMALAQSYLNNMQSLSAAQTDDAKKVAMREVISILGNPTVTETIATEHIKLFRKEMKGDYKSKLALTKSVVEASVLGKLNEAEAQNVENGVAVIVYGNDGSPKNMNFRRHRDRPYYRLKGARLFEFWHDERISEGDPFQVWLFRERDPATNHLRFAIARVNQNAAP